MNVGVGDGEAVGVSVGRKVCVAVAVSVCEGSGLKVREGSTTEVGTDCEIKVYAPHPSEKSVASTIETKDLFKFLQWMIQIPENA